MRLGICPGHEGREVTHENERQLIDGRSNAHGKQQHISLEPGNGHRRTLEPSSRATHIFSILEAREDQIKTWQRQWEVITLLGKLKASTNNYSSQASSTAEGIALPREALKWYPRVPGFRANRIVRITFMGQPVSECKTHVM